MQTESIHYIMTIHEDVFSAPSKSFQKIDFKDPDKVILYNLAKDGTVLASLEIYRRHIVSIETHYHTLKIETHPHTLNEP